MYERTYESRCERREKTYKLFFIARPPNVIIYGEVMNKIYSQVKTHNRVTITRTFFRLSRLVTDRVQYDRKNIKAVKYPAH